MPLNEQERQDNMPLNEQERQERLDVSEEKINVVLNTLDLHDLSPLLSFLNISAAQSDLNFDNLFSTQEDFLGSDIRMTVRNALLEWYIQDKFRESGLDLLLEICRMYRLDDLIILDGGRDLYRLFTDVPYEQVGDLHMVRRDWENTKTKSDLILFHPKLDPNFYWIRTEPAKEIAHSLFEDWKDNFSRIKDDVLNKVFRNSETVWYSDHLGTDMGVCCMRDRDNKWVAMPDGKIVRFTTAKVVVFIPYETKLSDQYVCTQLRRS